MELKKKLVELLYYWERQNIRITSGCSQQDINHSEVKLNVKLPSDFEEYFRLVNGMGLLYPNDSDDNGFLFYPLQGLTTVQIDKGSDYGQLQKHLIFADYMQNSWTYHVKLVDQNNYQIGISPSLGIFNSITNSLAEFIQFYITDDNILYSYELE